MTGRRCRVLGALFVSNQAKNLFLCIAIGIIHHDVEQEAVQLRLGERVGSLLLDRVLRCHDEKKGRQGARLVTHTDLTFAHGFQERALHFCRCPIDFIGEDEVAEDRAWLKMKVTGLCAIDFGSCDI